MSLSREQAWALVTEHTQSESLRKHMLAVEAAVRGYARRSAKTKTDWGFVALLHDFDYERYRRENHPFRGVEILKARGYPEWVTRAILSHADYSGVPRESRLEKTLYACDEMSGFVTAAALVRPSKSVLDLEASSVDQADEGQGVRARACRARTCRRGAEEIGLPLERTSATSSRLRARLRRWAGGALWGSRGDTLRRTPRVSYKLMRLWACDGRRRRPRRRHRRIRHQSRRFAMSPPNSPRAPWACSGRTAPARAR